MPDKAHPGIALTTGWYDGDTVYGVLDLQDGMAWGSRLRTLTIDGAPTIILDPQRLRIARVTAPELRDPGGAEALATARQIAPPGIYTIRRYGLEKWRRPLVDLILPDGQLFSDVMLRSTVHAKLTSIEMQLGHGQ